MKSSIILWSTVNMGFFDLMAEARIREWQQREPELTKSGFEDELVITGTEPMEVQLFKEILLLHKAADKSTEQSTQNEFLEKTRKLQTQLMVVLEQSGRSLAARQVSENIRLHLLEIKNSTK